MATFIKLTDVLGYPFYVAPAFISVIEPDTYAIAKGGDTRATVHTTNWSRGTQESCADILALIQAAKES